MHRYWRSALAAAFILCWAGAAYAELPPLISRDVIFGNPERAGPQISPCGKYLSYLAPDTKNVLQVWVRPIEGGEAQVVTADKKRGIRQYFWTYAPDQLIYLQDTDGDENFHLYGVNVTTKAIKELTPHKGVRAQVVDVDPKFPNDVLIGMNLKNRAKFDVYRLDLKTGEATLDTENPGNIMGWVADADFKVRAATAAAQDGGSDLMYRESTDQPWKTLRHWGSDEQGAAAVFSADNKTLYLVGNHDSNTARFLALDPATGKETVIAEDAEYDVGTPLVHPTKRTIQAVAINRAKVEWKVIDPTVAEDFAALAKLREGEFSVTSRDLEDKTWVVANMTDNGPVNYYTYDRGMKTAKFLFSNQPKLEGLQLTKMKPVFYKARDGLVIHGYLTVPVGVEAKNLPTVLYVHGGPWARDSWGYNPIHQWLANRGYAVLSVNYRGSTGYGKAFLKASYREWAGKMHDDLIDGVNWIVKEGVADPKKVAIMGGSYGGYATLVGLTFTPDVFCCGVDIVGPSNIITLLKTVPPYWAPMKNMWKVRVGDLETEESFLKSRSPLFYVDRIQVPLLIGQGKNDPRVKQAESDQIVEALRKANKPVEYVIYTDEGHGFARPENRLHFFGKSEEFLAKQLGGRFEPLGEIKGHSGVVK